MLLWSCESSWSSKHVWMCLGTSYEHVHDKHTIHTHVHAILMAISKQVWTSPLHTWFSASNCSKRVPARFLSVNQPVVSEHWRSLEHLWTTLEHTPLTSSSVDPPTLSRGKGCCAVSNVRARLWTWLKYSCHLYCFTVEFYGVFQSQGTDHIPSCCVIASTKEDMFSSLI